MEIERKFIPISIPENLTKYPAQHMQQGYLSTNPVVRVRKSNSEYYLTYKGGGMMSREEYNLPLTKDSYYHLLKKADGNIISKTRYRIPLENNLVAELDIFHEPFSNLCIVEVEFNSIEDAESFVPPSWFGDDVTYDKRYHNSYLSKVQITNTK